MQDGIRGEIQYWYEMAKVLDAAGKECKSPFVEMTLQVMQEAHPNETIEFRSLREQVWEAMKEAKWNKKYLYSLKSVDTLYKGSWYDISGILSGLMESIRSVYEKSNFYKEVRVVTFLDYVYQHLLTKMRKEFTIQKIMSLKGSEYQPLLETIGVVKIINSKFDQGFFVRELMHVGFNTKSAISMHSTQTSFGHKNLKIKNEMAKFKKHMEDCSKFTEIDSNMSMSSARPATAFAGSVNDMGGSGSAGSFGEDLMRPNSSWKKIKQIQPTRMLNSRQSTKSKAAFWFEKAERI